MLIDSHAHLDLLNDAEGAYGNALQAGVKAIISVGIDLKSTQKNKAYADKWDNVFFTAGLHPHDAAKADEAFWLKMEDLAGHGAKAIGECGLDFYRDRSPRNVQRKAFARQVEIAQKLNLPLIVHDRDAHHEVTDILEALDAGQVGGVLHCFSGDYSFARRVLDMNFCLGIAGVLTYPKNQALRDLVRKVPLERLLLETDCPYLSPVPFRGKPNEPSYMTHTWLGLADALQKKPEEIARQTTQNCLELFNLSLAEQQCTA